MFNPIANIQSQFLLSELINNEKREDKRGIEDFRDISIKKLEENGQIELKIGKTFVISQIFAKLITPSQDRANEGVIVFSIDSNNLRASAEYVQSNEDLSELRNKISNLLEKSLRDSRALDANSLCVVPGKLVWKIVVDVNIINNDGNIYDACMLATLATWMTFKIPFLRKTGDKIIITENQTSIALSTLHVPLSVTFGLYDNNTKFLVDPNMKEEKCVDGIIIISANKFAEICYLHTYGSIKVDKHTVNDLLIIAKSKIETLLKTLKNFVEKDRVGTNLKKESSRNLKKTAPAGNDMIVDEDDLEYTKKKKNLENGEQRKNELGNKKKGIPLYEIK